MTVRLVVASRNAKKLAELRRVLESAGIVGIEPVGLDEVPEYPEEPEDGATFADNALIKARSGVRRWPPAWFSSRFSVAVLRKRRP